MIILIFAQHNFIFTSNFFGANLQSTLLVAQLFKYLAKKNGVLFMNNTWYGITYQNNAKLFFLSTDVSLKISRLHDITNKIYIPHWLAKKAWHYFQGNLQGEPLCAWSAPP